MRTKRYLILVALIGAGWISSEVEAAESSSLQENLAILQRVGAEGQGHAEAVKAWPHVVQASADDLPVILASMRDENRLATNWVRAAVDAIAERTLAEGKALPVKQIDGFLADQTHSAHSRRLAFEWLTRVDEQARDRWLPKMLNDPSLELRHEALARKIEQAKAALAAGNKTTAIAGYREALQFARDKDQVDEAAKALRDLGETVDLPRHFGFVMNWQLIGPFDNRNKIGFDKAYAPEEEIKLDAEYPGLDQVVKWTPATTTQEYGELDLNELLGKHKGAIAYGVSYFEADAARPVELRLGCINANKVWLNGELITANHVYHSGSSMDQYVGKAQLKAGKNVILVKICQNEQTEDWAQDWKFQLRICDSLGTAVLPKSGGK